MKKQIAIFVLLSTALASLGLTLAKVDGPDNPPRAALDEYLSFLELPNPKPVRDELFHEDVVGYWSRGQTFIGRDAVVSEIRKAIEGDSKIVKSMKFDVETSQERVFDDGAWLGGIINIRVEMNDGRKFVRSIRMTLVLTEKDDTWQIVHEHSSLLNEKFTNGL
ncbi:MAG: nuclear transport factor 2 family protein [Phycisphaerae bacterium]